MKDAIITRDELKIIFELMNNIRNPVTEYGSDQLYMANNAIDYMKRQANICLKMLEQISKRGVT